MVRYTLKQCGYFLAIVEHGGIAQAARELNISQPAISQAIDKLEQSYGFTLFTRHHARGMALTSQGRDFYQSAKQLVQQAELVEQDARAIAANLSGSIKFGCFHTITPFYLSQLVQTYSSDHPQINLTPLEMQQDDIEEGLLNGDIDVALTYDMGLEQEKFDLLVLDQLKPFILLSRGHLLAKHQSLSLKQMASEPFVMFDGPSSRDYFRGILEQAEINPPVAFNATSMESARSAVANNLGFSLSVMRPKHKYTYDGGELVSIPITDEIDSISLVIARKKSRNSSPLIDQFITFCKGHYVFEKSR